MKNKEVKTVGTGVFIIVADNEDGDVLSLCSREPAVSVDEKTCSWSIGNQLTFLWRDAAVEFLCNCDDKISNPGAVKQGTVRVSELFVEAIEK